MNAIVKDFANRFGGVTNDRLGQDMKPEELDTLRSLLDKFFSEEKKEPEHQPDDVKKFAGGLVLRAPSGKVLLLLRSANEKNYGGYWGLPGGKAEEGEGVEAAALRECFEETGYKAVQRGPHKEINNVKTPNGFNFVTYLHETEEEFTPTLDTEHDDWMWASLTELPEKMHPGVSDTLSSLSREDNANDSIALDKDSLRTFDDAGRMHVALAHISKACINPYYGHEIPRWQHLGLVGDKVYRLYRDPEELAKGAATFNNIQILVKHTPVSVDDHKPDEIAGTTGSNTMFNFPYLDTDLTIWSKEGIALIESGLQKELSCGYGYDPVMEPGVFDGEPYDGRMTNIKGNHVALVSKGRAGPDVVVGDSALKPKENEMAKEKPLTRTAVLVQAALSAYFMPKIALDSHLKMSTALSSGLSKLGEDEKFITAALKKANFKKAIIKMAKDAMEPMMTPEAKAVGGAGPDDVILRILDMVDGQANASPAAVEEEEAQVAAPGEQVGETDGWKKGVMDALAKAGVDEAMAKTICDMFPGETKEKPPAVEDNEEDDDNAEDTETPEQKAAKEKEMKDTEKKAQDAAIAAAREGATADTMKKLGDIRTAERAVQPLIGEIAIAVDSAEKIYETALKACGVSIEGVDPSAYPALVAMLVKHKEAGKKNPVIANDSLSADDRATFDKEHGIAPRKIRHLG